ncbi:MAG TPA: hypothetical protein PKW80_08950 [Bacteroidales bacterium]|nr:hypothetical protein [Bacteroidales bacterium]
MKSYLKRTLTFILTLTAFSFIHAQSTSVFDANYFNKDNLAPPIKIGKGFHINDIYKQTRSCFTSETSNPNKLTPQQTGKKTSIHLFYTKTNSEYNDFKKRGASGKVSFLNLFTLGGQKLEEYANKNIKDEERLIFNANVDFGVYSFQTDPQLITEAKSLITQKRFQDFISFYGTHYISGIRKESSISVILTKTGTKNSSNENENSSVQTGGDIPLKGSGSFEIVNGNWTNRQLEQNEFSISVEIDGPAIEQSVIQGQIKDILNGDSQDKAVAIASIIESAIKNISDPNQSIITQYYYSPFTLYGIEGIYWDDKKQNQLTKINEAVIKVYSAKTLLDELVTGSGKEQLKQNLNEFEMPQNYITKIMNKYDEVLPVFISLNSVAEKYLTDLEVKYNNCSGIFCPSDSNCCNNNYYLADIKNYNLDKKIKSELDKVDAVFENVLKELLTPDCEKKNQGIITFQNKSSNPYNLYQGSKFIETIPGKASQSYNMNIGTYNFKAVQSSGYLIYPTENVRTAKITKACEEIILKIGFED